MRHPSVSEMQRAVACSASVVLPRLPDTEQSASALRGSRIHAWIAANLRGWPLPDIGKTKVSHIDLDALRARLGTTSLLCEAAYSYNGETSEYLGENIGRDYQRPGTLCGSADIVAFRAKALTVIDIKTGSIPAPSPVENWQLATLAMMAGISHGCSNGVTGIIATLNRDGSWDFGEPHTWTPAELATIRQRIDAARLQWHDADEMYRAGFGVEATPGRECQFCKARCQYNVKAQEEQAA